MSRSPGTQRRGGRDDGTMIGHAEKIVEVTVPAEAIAARVSVRVLRTDAEFDVIGPTWDAVLEHSEATVFQTYEWQRTWWKYFGGKRTLLVLLFDLDGTTVGIAPMFAERERLLGLPVATRIKFIGVGLSDYLSIIAVAGNETAVVGALAGWLASHPREWDVFDLEDVPQTCPSFEKLPASLESAGLRVYRYQGSVCPRIGLPGSEGELLRQLGPSSSYNLKRKLKRMHTTYTSEVRLVSKPDETIDRAIGDFAVIHGGRWKSQGHPSAFDDPHHRAFHAEVCRKMAARDWLRIFFLDIAGNPAAVNFSFNFRSTIYMYQSNAHGPDEVMKCSPGLLIRSIAMTGGIAEGMRVFDFMRGDEAYKYREWAAVDVNNWLLRSSSPTRGGSARFLLFLASEFLGKAAQRFKMEYYDYRRYKISGQSEDVPVPVYAMGKFSELLSMTAHFFARHLPSGRREQSNRKSKTDE